jgi:hypothetical protein
MATVGKIYVPEKHKKFWKPLLLQVCYGGKPFFYQFLFTSDFWDRVRNGQPPFQPTHKAPFIISSNTLQQWNLA